jgi:hypothetical protein
LVEVNAPPLAAVFCGASLVASTSSDCTGVAHT